MRRAFRVHSEVSRLRDESNGWKLALDAVQTPIFLIGQHSKVVGMNTAAASLASKKDGLVLARQTISTELPCEANRLRHAIEKAGLQRIRRSVKINRRYQRIPKVRCSLNGDDMPYATKRGLWDRR